MRSVAAIPCVGLLAGALAALFGPAIPTVVAVILLVVFTSASLAAYRIGRGRHLAVSVSTAFAAAGHLLTVGAWERAWRPPLVVLFDEVARDQLADAAAAGRQVPADPEAFMTIEGVLRADASAGSGGASLSVLVDRVVAPVLPTLGGGRSPPGNTLGGVALSVSGTLAADRVDQWRAGRRVRMPALLRRPSRYFDPGVADQERALARRGIRLVGSVKSGTLVEVLARGSPWSECLAAARAFARRAIAAHVGRWSDRSAAIVAAIVIGDRAGLDDDLQRALQASGTYHVIAISGGNIAILAGLLLGAFRLAGWLGRAAFLVAIALLVTYGVLVGGGASVDRATLMAVVYFGARVADHRAAPLNTLAGAATLLVAADPLSVADPAFALTFGATLGILVVLPGIRDRWRASAIGPGLALLDASLSAELMLLPIAALIFSRVTFAGLALNFLAIPLMAVAQVAGMAVVPFALFSRPLAEIAGGLAHAGASGLVLSANLVRFAPALVVRVAAPSAIAIAIYYLMVAVAIGSRRGRRRAIATVAWIGTGMAGVWIVAEPWTVVAAGLSGRLRVTFIDVGQGDSALVRFPRGSTLLIDAGGLAPASAFDVGDRVVAPVLRASGLRHLTFLALTHGDPDHIGGAASILREFRPDEIWEGIPVARSDALTALRTNARADGSRWSNVHAGDHIDVDGVEVRALHPPREDWERQKVRNDDSLVLELGWRGVSFVFPGDIGRTVERGIVESVTPARLRVVKVPHHGSLGTPVA